MVGVRMLVGEVLDSSRGRGMTEKRGLGMTGGEGIGERGVVRVIGRIASKGLGMERGK